LIAGLMVASPLARGAGAGRVAVHFDALPLEMDRILRSPLL
jgi:hypothetical protein